MSSYYEADREECQWGMFAHLATFAGYLGIPMGNILGPLVVWLIKKEESDFVSDHAKEALNFQITLTIALIPIIVACFFIIGFVFLFALVIVDLVYTILAAMAANRGEDYRYPCTIRFVN